MSDLEYIKSNLKTKGESDCPICKKGIIKPDTELKNTKDYSKISSFTCDNCGLNYHRTF